MAKKRAKNVCIGNVIIIIPLFMIVFNTAIKNVFGAQGNTTYHFVFDYEGDTDVTASRTKWFSNDSAYINCINAENEDACFYAWFYFWNDYDGTQCTNSTVTLWQGSERWVSNSATEGDSTWFKAKLFNSGFIPDEGGIFEGRWRPDASSY